MAPGPALLLLVLLTGLALVAWTDDAAPAPFRTPSDQDGEVAEAGPAGSFLPVAAAVVVWHLLRR